MLPAISRRIPEDVHARVQELGWDTIPYLRKGRFKILDRYSGLTGEGQRAIRDPSDTGRPSLLVGAKNHLLPRSPAQHIMPRVVFIGLGLNDEKGMTIEGLEAARQADRVFAEFYTSTMPNLQLSKLEDMIGKKVEVLTRTQLEDENGKRILASAECERVAFLVPGDPMIATTHVALRLELARKRIESRIIHGASIFSSVCGATGLQSTKFGRSTTLPRDGPVPPSVIEAINENRARKLHTLLLLELKTDGKSPLTVKSAIARISETHSDIAHWLAVGVARIGSRDQQVRAAKAAKLLELDLGAVPHSLVFPGKLHFMEAEALKAFAGASDADLEGSL